MSKTGIKELRISLDEFLSGELSGGPIAQVEKMRPVDVGQPTTESRRLLLSILETLKAEALEQIAAGRRPREITPNAILKRRKILIGAEGRTQYYGSHAPAMAGPIESANAAIDAALRATKKRRPSMAQMEADIQRLRREKEEAVSAIASQKVSEYVEAMLSIRSR